MPDVLRPTDPPIFRDMKGFARAVRAHAARFKRNPKVYTHQQVGLDQRGSVVAKVRSLLDAEQHIAGCEPVFLWIDTDRAGANGPTLRLHLPMPDGRQKPIRFAPAHVEKIEARTIRLDRNRLHAAVHAFTTLSAATYGRGAHKRIDRVAQILSAGGGKSYTETLIAVIEHLHTGMFGRSALSQRVSTLLNLGLFDDPLKHLLSRRQELVATWNAAITRHTAQGQATAVRPIPATYLPLFGRGPNTERLRLHHETQGTEHKACLPDGTHYASLGATGADITALSAAGWSPDVSLPVLANHLYDGMIVGQSSSKYMRVISDVIQNVLGQRPIPMFLPQTTPLANPHDSLLDLYLSGGHCDDRPDC